ncbi:MAG TPA: DegV family protein [Jatrophihabitans sp.]|nr:DegV family protein [Jatrophihabitans sp.]
MSSPQWVTVVTDSTSYLPVGLADRLSIRVMPLQVQLGDRTGLEGVDVGPAELTRALRERLQVSTSRPTPRDFVQLYGDILNGGSGPVVSLHLSAELSGTCDSARLAAREFEAGQVRVIDSRAAGMALGFGVLAAAKAAAAGVGAEQVEQVARATFAGTSALFYVDSLEWLHRGGRIGATAARFGTALAVKPLLHLSDGRIAPLEKVRTASKAIARLVQLSVAAAGERQVDVAVQHLAAAERAGELADQVRAALPGLRQLHTAEVGAAVGAHVGPGLLGIVVAPVSD